MPPGILTGVYDNSNIIRGQIIKTAIVKPGKMDDTDVFMYTERPIYTDSQFIDMDKSSSLSIYISKGLLNNRIMITLTAASMNLLEDGTGKLSIDFNAGSGSPSIVSVSIPLRQNFSDFYAQSKTFTGDSTTIKFSSPDFQDLTIFSVKLDIFTPREFALATGK